MSNVDSKNFYEVLGVERTADARAIKKAYFALVRKYPPETKPAEFQKIREAYEVLSDDNARRDYDSIGFNTNDSAISAEVTMALEAMDEGRFGDARQILTRLLQANPGLAFARDLLGTAFLRDKMFPNAEAIFQSLVKEHPENGAYVLHLGYAQHAQKKYGPAEQSYRTALQFSKDDVRPLVALADCLMDQKRWDDAIATLDQAINLDGSVDFRDFALFTRKLEVEAERRNPAGVTAVLAELKNIIPPDEAGRKYVANRLAAIAAPLFAQKLPDLANLLMKEAAALDPSRGTGQMPTTFTLEIETLPESSRQWLIRHKSEKSMMKMDGSPRGWPIFGLIIGIPAIPILLAAAFAEGRPAPAEGLAFLGAAFFLVAWMVAASIVRLIDVQKSPYGKYVTVHPFFLLDVNVDRLTAWPLANLHDVRLTHHHTNGVYSTTNVAMVFAKKTYTTSIYGKEKSVEWANRVLASRRRMLEVMFSGVAEEADPDANLIPARLVPDEGNSAPLTENGAKKKKRNRTVLLGSLGFGVLMALILIPINVIKEDNYDFRQAEYEYTPREKLTGYLRYLEQHPHGRHVDDANQGIEKIYDDAVAKVQSMPNSAVAPMMTELLATLRKARSNRIGVRYESHTLFEKLDLEKIPEKYRENLIDPRKAFGDTANAAREATITRSIQSALDTAVGAFLEVGEGQPRYDYRLGRSVDPLPAPAEFVIAYDVELSGSIYTSDATAKSPSRRFLGIAFIWDFGVQFGDEKALKYEFELPSRPAKNISWTTYGDHESETLPYDKMAESAFDDFSARLSSRFKAEGDLEAEDEGDLEGEEDEPAPPPRPAPKRRK